MDERRVWGRRIRALRERCRQTVPQFAADFGVTAASVYNWEQGRSTPMRALQRMIVQAEAEASVRGL